MPADLVKVLIGLGEMVTATQSIDDDTLRLLGGELNYDVQVVSPEDEDRELLEQYDLEFGEDEGEDEDLEIRPPVVTVMGHVDHGKTRLLDAIRKTNVIGGEAGGITQHIGAYQVVTTTGEGVERKITFIDTPGHEAFTAMRARGAQVTDISILVVAADDGVKPQTIEALNHAQAAGVPIVVAVNKVDKEGADPMKVRAQLTEYGLVAEEFGGDTMFVDVSAKQGQGIESLLEAVLLTADATLDLRANPNQDAQGVAIEAHLDRGRGPVATVLVQRGTLRAGDSIVAGDAHGRVRAMLDDEGNPVEVATPSMPVQVLGLTSVPGAGDSFMVVAEDRVARQIAQTRQARERNALLAKNRVKRSLEDFLESLEKGEVQELNLIIKGDVSGSVEALEDALLKIEVGDEVNLRVIHRGVGAINKNDVHARQRVEGRHHRLQRPAGGQGCRAGDRGGRRRPVLQRHLPGPRRGRGGAAGHAQAGVRRGPARHGPGSRRVQVQQVRDDRGLLGADRRGTPQRQGPPDPRRRRRRRQPDDRRAAAVQGRRHRGPRGLRVRYQPRLVPGRARRGRHRDVRDAREAAQGIGPTRTRPASLRGCGPCLTPRTARRVG